MAEPALGTDRLVQVGIVVADVEATARAWSQVLGLPMPEIRITDTFDLARTEYDGAPTFAQARMAFLSLGQVDLELLEPVGEPSTWDDQLRRNGPSLHHVAFEVDGMAEKRAYLGGKGLNLIQRGEFGGGRYAYFDGQASLGVVLELLERDEAAEQAEAGPR